AGALAAAIPDSAGPWINKLPFQAALMANSTLGGIASVAGGDKFANGAVTGAFGYLFNAANGRLIGGLIGGAIVAGTTGPEDVPGILLGHYLGGEIGSIIEDWFAGSGSENTDARDPNRYFSREQRQTLREKSVDEDGNPICQYCDRRTVDQPGQR